MDRQSAGITDFKQADLHIARIETVYYEENGLWSRSTSSPRLSNGLVFVCVGSVEYRTPQEVMSYHSGDILKLLKDIPCSAICLSPASSFYVIDFDTADADEFERFPLPSRLSVTDFNETEKEFRGILQSWESDKPGSRLECRSKIYTLLYHLLDQACSACSSPSERKFFDDTVDYIRQHFTESELFIGSIAEAMNISESQFRRCFQKYMRQTPVDYIRTLRIERAKEMLRYSALSITEIAYGCGFTSPYYFSRSFKAETGFTPLEFRNL